MAGSASKKQLVLITGSSGLIGSRLARRLKDDYRVVGLDVQASKDADDGADWIECDLTDDESLATALETVARKYGTVLASVVHLAAYYDFKGEPSDLYEQLTVEGTRRLLKGLKLFKTGQFIFSSSLLVMRPVETGETLDEDSPTEAAWDYPRSKLEAEQVIRETHAEIPAVILRIAGVYDEDGHSIPIGQQALRIEERQLESYFFPGNASHGQAFVHLDDLIDCFKQTIERRKSLGSYEVFLIAEPDVMSYAELQDAIGAGLHGREWPTIRIPKVAAKAGAWVQDKLAGEGEETFIKPWMVDLADAHYPVSITKARLELEWEPRHRLRKTLPEILRRLKADPEGWRDRNGFAQPAPARGDE